MLLLSKESVCALVSLHVNKDVYGRECVGVCVYVGVEILELYITPPWSNMGVRFVNV